MELLIETGEEHAGEMRMDTRAVAATLGRILVVRLGSLGDIVHTLPAIATLRATYPEATIGWVLEERWAPLLCARRSGPRGPERPLIDVLHLVHTRDWRRQPFARKTWREIREDIKEVRGMRYEVAADFQGAIRSAVLAQVSRAPRTFGFSRTREAPASMLYTHREEARGHHVAEQNMALALAIAPQAQPVWDFPLPIDTDAELWAREFLREHWSGEFCVLNPGAGWGAKCWPAERFAAVARALAMEGLRTIVNVGPGEEELASAVVAQSEGTAFATMCTLAQLMSMLRRARMCVGGDTGPTHLAGALGVPVVGIYGPTDPQRNGPIGAPNIVLRHESSVTSHARRRETEAGLLNIAADEVIAAARQLLAETAGRVR